jgi:hypothetical protein
MHKSNLELVIGGRKTLVTIIGGMKPAHGMSLDGKTKVQSLKIGQSAEHPGKLFVADASGNAIMTTKDELFVALQHAAPDYEIRAVKKQ